MLRVLVLGAVQASERGRPLHLGGRKHRVLVARLAMAMGQPIPVSILIDDLWGDESPRDPVHALQAQVSRLRSVLGTDVELLADGYRLDPGGVETDAADFVRLSEHGRRLLTCGSFAEAAVTFREALALWRGPAFADLPDIAALHAETVWLDKMREATVADRIDADLASGTGARTVPELYSLVQEHPLAERHWGQLMTALYHDGRSNEALDAYTRARETFVDQLGTEPGTLLRRLHQEMLQECPPEALIRLATTSGDEADRGAVDRGEAVGRAVAGRAVVEHATRGTPDVDFSQERSALIGREHELSVLEQAWSEAQRTLRVVTITGEPGIGKSYLATEFASRLEEQAVTVLHGRCEESLNVAYQPFMEMLRTDLDAASGQQLIAQLGPSPAELTRVLPGLSERLPADVPAPLRSDPATEHYRIFDAVAGWLSSLSQQKPVCLVIDDFQWSGPETMLLLKHLLTTRRTLHALVLVTHRDREHLPGSPENKEYAALLRQSGILTRLPLSGLDEDEVGQLLSSEFIGAAADTEVAEDLTTRASSASGGNPLFVLELARHYAGGLTGGSGDDDFAETLPTGLRDVIAKRLDSLPQLVRQRLEYAAVIGRSIDPATLSSIEDFSLGEIDDLLTTASYTGLIEPVPGPRLCYTFCHDVVRTALYDDMPPLRRAAMHLKVAAAIEHRFGTSTPSRYRELGYHYSKAVPVTSVASAVRYLKLAGNQSMEQRAPAAAADLYRSALGLLTTDGDYETLCDLMIASGTAELQAGDAAYRESLLTAARLALDAGDAPRLTAAAVANNRGWYSSTADIDAERVAVIEAALANCAPDDKRARAQLLVSWALENVRDPSRRNEAIARSNEALRLAERLDDGVLLGQMLSNHYAVVYASFSDPHGSVELCIRLHELAEARADPGLQLNASISLAQASMMVGDFATADRALDRAAELGETMHQPARQWMVKGWQAMRLAMRGDLAAAEARATTALEHGVQTGQPDALTWFAGQLFTIRLLAGRLPELIDAIEEQVTSNAGGIPAWRAAYALALTEVGRADEAEVILDEFLSNGFDQLPFDMLWLHGMSYLCGVCAALGRPIAARELYDALEPHSGLIAHNGTIDAGPVDLHLGTMARIYGDPQAATRHLTAAVDLCQRIDAPTWLARAREQMRAVIEGGKDRRFSRRARSNVG